MDTSPVTPAVLDNRGSNCVAGFAKLLEMMDALGPGETLTVLSTDPASQRELADWSKRSGHSILKSEKIGPFWKREYHYLIRKESTKENTKENTTSNTQRRDL